MEAKSNICELTNRVKSILITSDTGLDELFLTMLKHVLDGKADCEFLNQATGASRGCWHFIEVDVTAKR